MKKFFCTIVAVFMLLTLGGCGGEKSSKEQEKLVTDFFDYMAKGDLDSIKSIMTESGYRQIEALKLSFDAGFSDLSNDSYGDATIQETKNYMDYAFSKLFKDVKIKEVEVGDEDTVVKITGKIIETDKFDEATEKIDFEAMMTSFTDVEENKAKMIEVYNEKGQEEAVKWVVDQIAPTMFAELKKAIDGCSYSSYDGSFRIIKENDQWLINSINL